MSMLEEPRRQVPVSRLIDEEERRRLQQLGEELRVEGKRRRQERAQQRAELLALYTCDQLQAMRIRDLSAAAECDCGCHPQPPQPGVHGDGLCVCQQTPEEQQQVRDALLRDLQEAGQRIDRGWQQEQELIRQAAEELGAEIEQAGGVAPYQIIGRVHGVNFYLRERHGEWRLQVPDAEAGDDGDPVGVDGGTLIIAEGAEESLYRQDDPAHPLRLAAGLIAEYLRRRSCDHPGTGRYCSECGKKRG